MMSLQGKNVLAHRGYFDQASMKMYRENSREVCSIACTKDYITTIELDVRKSKDGILYCFHGSLLQYFVTLKIPRTFSYMKTKYNVDRLSEILEVIPEDKIVLLDIKDASITKEDILSVFAGKKFKEIVLANKSVSLLDRFSGMPPEFVKIINCNVFSNLYDMKKLKEKNYKYLEVNFPFQLSGRIMRKAEENGLIVSYAGMFAGSRDAYWKKINKYGVTRVLSDYV